MTTLLDEPDCWRRLRVERQIAAAEANGGEPPVALQKRRAGLAEQIAHRQSGANASRK